MEEEGLNINHIYCSKITREEIEKHFANDKRLDKILTIFDKVDSINCDKFFAELFSSLPIVSRPGMTVEAAIKEHEDSVSGFEELAAKYDVEGILECENIKAMLGLSFKDSQGEKRFLLLDNSRDGKVTDGELERYFEEAKDFYGDDIELDDFKKFLGFLVQEGDKNHAEDIQRIVQETGLPEKLVERYGNAAIEFKEVVGEDGKKYLERNVKDTFDGYTFDYTERCDMNGNLVETRDSNCGIIGYEGAEEINRYDENGTKISTSYINHETGEETHFKYAQNIGDNEYKLHIKDGVATLSKRSGSEFENEKLDSITFGTETSDSTKVSFKYDENNQLSGIDITDNALEEDKPRGFSANGKISPTHVPQKTVLEAAEFDSIKSMLDGGAEYGEDFDLKIVDGKLKVVPKIKNKNGDEIPELKGAAFDKYKEMVSKGVHAEEDFDVEYDKNGNFRYKFKNNQARDFDSSYKTELYDKDGNFVSSVTVKDNEVIRETVHNGEKQIQRMSFDDAFMQFVFDENFALAGEILGDADILSGGHDIYTLADKYKERTGKELVLDAYDARQNELDDDKKAGISNLLQKLQPHGDKIYGVADPREAILKNYEIGYEEFKTIRNFDPYKSKIADYLPKISRTYADANSFTEKINDDSFSVKIQSGKIAISKNNGTEIYIDVSSFPENYVKNILSKVSSSILYDIAKTGTPLKLDDKLPDGTNGYYIPSGGITLNPNSTSGQRAVNLFAHECGHMCDHIDDKDNAIKAVKEQMKNDPFLELNRDKGVTINELIEKRGTLQPVSIADEQLKEKFEKEKEEYRKNRPNVNENAEYALDNLAEFFAESYSLLNIGTCKSEYVIANYFPESFARVKEIIEQNRQLREK